MIKEKLTTQLLHCTPVKKYIILIIFKETKQTKRENHKHKIIHSK